MKVEINTSWVRKLFSWEAAYLALTTWIAYSLWEISEVTHLLLYKLYGL